MLILKPFNAVYIVFMLITVAIIFAIHFIFKNKSEKAKTIFIVLMCALNVIIFFIYKAFLSVDREFVAITGIDKFNWFNELPLQLCNINMFLVPIGVLTKKRGILGFSFFLAPLGALMAMLLPETAFCGYSLLLPRMAGFWLTHALIFISGFSILALGFYKPDFKDFGKIFLTFISVAFGIHLVNTVFRATVCDFANYFYTYEPSVSLLELFWKFIPIPFLYELPALLILGTYMVIVTFIIKCFTKKSPIEATQKEKVKI